jgi:AhpC/TSA family
LDRVRARGVEVAAISPEPAAAIAAFVTTHGIRYPVLADTDSSVVRAYGILNPNTRPHGAGVPFPGQFLLDAQCAVVAKSFSGDLRLRASGTMLVDEYLGPSGPPTVTASTEDLDVALYLSTTTLAPGQEAAVHLDLGLAPGSHIYAHDVALPYVGLDLHFEPDSDHLLSEQSFEYPPPTRSVEFAALGEELAVYEDRLRVTGRVRLRWSPPFTRFTPLAVHDTVRRLAMPPGPRVVPAVLRYQACTDTDCRPPAAVKLEVPITVMPTPPPIDE